MSPIAISGVDKQGIDINGVQVKQALSDANETVNQGVFAATTLSAVDTDLAVANIKSGVTIFGKLGTFSQTLAEDIVNKAIGAASGGGSGTYTFTQMSINAGADWDAASLTQNYSASSRAVGFATTYLSAGAGLVLKTRLIMDGVQVAEGDYLITTNPSLIAAMGTRALSGAAKLCICRVHNYGAVTVQANGYTKSTAASFATTIQVGSIKQV